MTFGVWLLIPGPLVPVPRLLSPEFLAAAGRRGDSAEGEMILAAGFWPLIPAARER
jgi:hypothetical protein